MKTYQMLIAAEIEDGERFTHHENRHRVSDALGGNISVEMWPKIIKIEKRGWQQVLVIDHGPADGYPGKKISGIHRYVLSHQKIHVPEDSDAVNPDEDDGGIYDALSELEDRVWRKLDAVLEPLRRAQELMAAHNDVGYDTELWEAIQGVVTIGQKLVDRAHEDRKDAHS